MKLTHDLIERNIWLMVVLVVLVVAVGGLVEIVPLYFQRQTTQAAPGIKPYEPLRLIGRDLYIREGCVGCHSQMIRTLQAETQRYGHYSVAGEFVYDHPFLWGSKRTGPDLARVGGRYSDEWHRVHLLNPRDVVPESNMPAYAWLGQNSVADVDVAARMRALQRIGVPYSEEDIAGAAAALQGKTELDAVIAYLQGLGLELRRGR